MAGKKIGKNPTDRAKIGTKRSLTTDKNGIPLSCPVAGANKNDFKILRETLEPLGVKESNIARSMCLDKGYDFEEVRISLFQSTYDTEIDPSGIEMMVKRFE